MLSVNVTSAFLMSRQVLPGMVEAGGGAIVHVGSVQSAGAVGNSAAYVTSKHALLGLARSIAVDFALGGAVLLRVPRGDRYANASRVGGAG